MKRQTNGHKWTSEETKAFITLWTDSEPVPQIAKAFKTTERAILKFATRLRNSGVPLPYRRRGHIPNRFNKPWSHSEVEYVVRRRNEGATAEIIAAETGRTFYGVQGIIQALRKNGVDVPMLGNGVRRLWDADALRAFCVSSEADRSTPARSSK